MEATDLRPAPYNPREISAEAFLGLGFSLEEFGDLSGITWNKKTKHIVSGHQRVEALRALHAAFIDDSKGPRFACNGEEFHVRVVDWPEAKEKAANIAANNQHIAGKFTAGLGNLLGDVKASLGDVKFGELKFDLLERDALGLLGKVETTEVGTPEPPANPITKPGDVWTLGDHTIVCSDSINAKLQTRVDSVITDPPYALFGSSTGASGVSDDKMIRPFFRQLFSLCVSSTKEHGHVFAFCDWHSVGVLLDTAQESGLTPRNLCVWDKGGGGVGNMFQNQHELIWFFSNYKHTKTTSKTSGARTVNGVGNIWHVPREKTTEHNAQKPVALIAIPVQVSSDKGETILDPFLGSGTTLIACEQLGRKCYGFEIEPKYCDLAVERWEELTGGQATKKSGA